jgi:ribA/ribD-fused uncharacterized protein
VRIRIAKAATPGTAKRLGRAVSLRTDWETIKFAVMENLLRQKFANPALRWQLLATGSATLHEGNSWGDRIWGECPLGVGENHLGRLLMKIRDELRAA